MNTRDELTRLILGKTAPRAADSILAAGYRKPRTITTAEELDALPAESVVLSATSHVYQHESEEDVTWWAHPGDQRVYASRQVRLPATVLHVGGPL
jgi:hypothetical protein